MAHGGLADVACCSMEIRLRPKLKLVCQPRIQQDRLSETGNICVDSPCHATASSSNQMLLKNSIDSAFRTNAGVRPFAAGWDSPINPISKAFSKVPDRWSSDWEASPPKPPHQLPECLLQAQKRPPPREVRRSSTACDGHQHSSPTARFSVASQRNYRCRCPP